MIIEDLLKQMKLEYIETIPEKCKRILAFLKDDNRTELETEFHKMKGTGKTYGLGEMSKLGEVLEKICMNEKLDLQDSVPTAVMLLENIYQSRKLGNEFIIEDSDEFQVLKIKNRKIP